MICFIFLIKMNILKVTALLLGFIFLIESKTVKYAKIAEHGGNQIKIVLLQETNEENEAPEKKDIFDINNDETLIDGDIVLNKDRNTLANPERLWSTTIIPITYNADLSLEAIGSIEYARIEYELRTCLKLVDRTTESNYIDFNTLDGCYSSVGEVGGPQTISIGNGCERIGTVIHEIMHAIGIYHEQSRSDRDDYVKIELENVDDGKEGNFNKYTYMTVDDRGVSYDYNSVMHYSDTSFSNNGEPTIVTRDPAYQDVIGQRRAFSPGDVTKINSMYQCSDTVRLSYSCAFNEATICGYVQNDTDTGEWIFHQANTDPSLNYPFTIEGNFIIFDTNQASVQGSLHSMRMKSKASTQCLEFSYHFKKAAESATQLNVYVAEISQLDGEVVSKGKPVITISQSQDYDWNMERVSINAKSTYKIIFEAVKDQAADVIAINDVSVVDKPCETGYFVIRDFSELIATSTKGDYFFSPTMYTDDGYAFKIKVYPVGSSSSSYTGYMGMYYAVAMGVNDDELAWPFADRFIRFSVVDQHPDAVSRMSQSNSIMTDDTNDAWEKPTSSVNSGYGFSAFMSINDITNTRSFLKHDAVVISIEVRDLSSKVARKQESSMQSLINPMQMSVQDDSITTNTKEFGYSLNESFIIIGISAACVFLFMVIVFFIVNERNSKQLNKAMLDSTK